MEGENSKKAVKAQKLLLNDSAQNAASSLQHWKLTDESDSGVRSEARSGQKTKEKKGGECEHVFIWLQTTRT